MRAMRLMQGKPGHPPRAISPLEPLKGSPIAPNILGFALALACAAGAAMNLAHGRVPWPPDFFIAPDHLEAIIRTLVTALLGAALIVVLREPKLEVQRVRKDDPRDR